MVGSYDWDFSSTFPLNCSLDINANDLFLDDLMYDSGGSISNFPLLSDQSLPLDRYSQDMFPASGVELSRPEPISLSDRQAQVSPWDVNSPRPESVIHALSSLGIFCFDDIL
jgi:hypothetical protein